MTADISVIIPTYKREESLMGLLRCLEQQIEVELEIIVVDQNPENFFSDKSKNILQKVKRIPLERPNASTARNVGFSNATAHYLLFIDDDLLPEPDFCIKGLTVFKNNPKIDCFVPLVYSDTGKEVVMSVMQRKKKPDDANNESLFSISDTITAALFFRKEAFSQTGGFDEYLFEFAGTAEDQEFFLRIFKNGFRLWCALHISVFHNEKVAGGCDLRTADYWKTREKCIRSWVFRYRIHSIQPPNLSVKSIYLVSRSTFLNKEVLLRKSNTIFRQIRTLIHALKESKFYLNNKANFYRQNVITFLKPIL